MKKIFSFLAIFSVLILMSGVAVAATAKKPVQYTADQQACIKVAQIAKADSFKLALQTLNAATKDALQAKQNALQAAQDIKDPVARKAAIKAANEAYNNNEAVRQAEIPYEQAIKAANDKFNTALKSCTGIGGFFRNIVGKLGASLSGSANSNSAPDENNLGMPGTQQQYTAEQQACIKVAQIAKADSFKAAEEALNAATADAFKLKQDALKAAQDIKDSEARKAAIKAANEKYNNNEIVQQAKVPYMAAIKAASDKFQASLKACTGNKGVGGFFRGIGNGFSNAFGKIWKFLSWKK